MEILLPVLRADFAMFDSYVHKPRPRLLCPITAFGGTRDEWVRCEEIDAWAELTASGFRSVIFEGGHFFIQAHVRELVATVMRDMESL